MATETLMEESLPKEMITIERARTIIAETITMNGFGLLDQTPWSKDTNLPDSTMEFVHDPARDGLKLIVRFDHVKAGIDRLCYGLAAIPFRFELGNTIFEIQQLLTLANHVLDQHSDEARAIHQAIDLAEVINVLLDTVIFFIGDE